LNEERAIVSDIPGTTRDTIEETININGIIFRLIDTAGIREASDEIEKIGVQKTLKQIEQSTLMLYVFDIHALNEEEVLSDLQKLNTKEVRTICVANKCEHGDREQLQRDYSRVPDIIFISAKTRQHINDLKHLLVDSILQGRTGIPDVIVSNARHYDALLRTQQAIDDTLSGLEQQLSKELIALDLRQALQALGEISGTIVHDELLDNIFSKFCIGK
jgi:tRNA modification GTPase